MTLKEELDKIWSEYGCLRPLHICGWLPQRTAQRKGVAHWIIGWCWTNLVLTKGRKWK